MNRNELKQLLADNIRNLQNVPAYKQYQELKKIIDEGKSVEKQIGISYNQLKQMNTEDKQQQQPQQQQQQSQQPKKQPEPKQNTEEKNDNEKSDNELENISDEEMGLNELSDEEMGIPNIKDDTEETNN